MPDNWLFTGEVPEFVREQQFTKSLKEQLNNASIYPGTSDYSNRSSNRATLQAEHTINKISGGTIICPDVTISPSEATIFDRAFIESKMGSLFKSTNDVADEQYGNTGLKDIGIHFRQFYNYKYGDQDISFDTKKSEYDNNMPEGNAPVIATCPYMLTDNFYNYNSPINGQQFVRTICYTGLWVLFRRNENPVLKSGYHNHYTIVRINERSNASKTMS